MAKYSIGIDYGTLSGRAVLVDISNGNEIATEILEYKHGVMDEYLCGTDIKLPLDYALQHPRDYIDVLEYCVPAVIKKSGVHKSDIIGLGVDFTSCTLLSVYKDGTPLCYDEKFNLVPCSYVKLWKDHSSALQAKRLTDLARAKGMKFIERYGGNISSEWLVPKVMHILDNAPEIYESADFFIEAADWIVWQLTGVQTRSSCTSGYKALWHASEGYPPKEFFAELDPRLENLVTEKLDAPVLPLGSRAGVLTKDMADKLGLIEGIAVAVGNIDGHCTVPAAKVLSPGQMLLILGTSACFMTLDERELDVKEIAGYVKDGMIPDYYGYEAGQACMGDHFAWYIKNMLPYSYKLEADALGISEMQYIFDKASKLGPGECGLIALDWWNGNRALAGGSSLSGSIIGMNLSTKPEDIFRALVEATAYGARVIIDNYKKYSLKINEIHAAGGIAEKNPFVMQLYADILGCDIMVSGSPQAAALGAAIFGSVAAGKSAGGYDNVVEAAEKMGKLKDVVYKPNLENKDIYDSLYNEFCFLFDYFGRGKNKIMKKLKNIKE
ncbi:MAG: ribulokinase [Ruminococcaceae bacterium]|nr:ribulokinase [Oscillospiraceae bacterium]